MFKMLRAYVRDLIKTFEHTPVPGAQRSEEFAVPRETWDLRWKQCSEFFEQKGLELLNGSKSSLREAWKTVTEAIDRKMKTHAKCDMCSLQASAYDGLIGQTTQEANHQRGKIQQAKLVHQTHIANERAVMDDAGFRAIAHPESQWTVIADGATQRNFQLPKLQRRSPKSLAQSPLYCSKLYGVFGYG